MLNLMKYSLPQGLDEQVEGAISEWSAANNTARLWEKDASLWTNDDEAKWLGWLDIACDEIVNAPAYRELRLDIETAGFTDVLLMGMGGSSLSPEVLALTFSKTNFHILDSTVPEQVKAVEAKLDLAKTLFIVASKSGSTLEPNCFKQYFFERLSQVIGVEKAGSQFIAITDPGSKMEQLARQDGFRHIFYGKPDIGGRFSALSAFGMVPAAIMGLNVEEFLDATSTMVDACREGKAIDNPGVLLGIILGICHRNGRDKLTIISSPEISDLGAWLEQLIAESTGKSGVAIIPVDQEPILPAASYGNDRIFAFLTLEKDQNPGFYEELVHHGHPAVRISLTDKRSLGQEFFRWEIATAVAGSLMGINPFDQPDVESAKIEARKITDEYEQTGSLPAETPFIVDDTFSLFSNEEYIDVLKTASTDLSVEGVLTAHLESLRPQDYFAILAFVEMNAPNNEILTSFRQKFVDRYKNATCLGFGPRFLHSTGQAYKGGANNGVFLQITSEDAIDLPVPGQSYTFGVVKAAQARGDLKVLLDRGRRAIRVHINGDTRPGLERLAELFA